MPDLWLILQTLGGIGAVLLFLRWYEPRMMYYPNVPARRIERVPDEAGIAYESVWLKTSDGVRILGWFLPTAKAHYTLLFCHGNAGNISHRIEKMAVFQKLGFNVFLFDYRGYGESQGKPNEQGTYRDAEAALEYLIKTRGIAPETVVLYGESLGTGVAVEIATRYPIAGLILEAPYTSLADVGQRIVWFLPVWFIVRNRYESRRKLPRVSCPLLILHSREDEIFSYSHAERLLAAANSPKRLVELQGGHANAFFVSLERSKSAIAQFLRELPVPYNTPE